MVSSVQAIHGRTTLRGISEVFVAILVPEMPARAVEFLKTLATTENGNSAILYAWDCNGPSNPVLNMVMW